MSRKDVADSLPGVAISISLVPPLCVVGVALSIGEIGAATGALLLFVTNFFSILLAGGGVLALLGLAGAATKDLNRHARRRAFTYIALGAAVIAIPLAATSIQIARESITENVTKRLAQDWTAGTKYDITKVDAIEGQVNLTINGSGEPPNLVELGEKVRQSLDRFVTIKLTIVPSEEQVYGTLDE
jgi:uncharacterized membrane protein